MLSSPATQEFAALTSTGSTNDLRIRFDAATGFYEVLASGTAWQPLRPSGTYSSSPNHYFAYGPTNPQTTSFFQVRATAVDAPPTDYKYSSMAAWGTGVGAYWDPMNVTAFGVATTAGSVPVTGSATYQGQILGVSDILQHDYLIGAQVAASITGDVSLSFNFGVGTLTGSMHPLLHKFGGTTDLGSLSFASTVYSSGSATFSGQFATSITGPNAFEGLFTGPAAQELIGRWTLPFVYSGDSANHSATGAWIAKR